MFAGRLLRAVRNPAQIVVIGFALLILTGAVLLRLPVAVDSGASHPGFRHALFWSTSATTVTGLSSTDVGVFSLFGELVLLVLIQVGGFGIMTAGSVLAVVASNRMGLRQRLLAKAEIGVNDVGELRHLVTAIAKFTVGIELVIAVILAVRFAADDGTSPRAVYSGVFHAVSGFNNAGITLTSDNLVAYVHDPVVVLAVTTAIILGGLGFPVLVELGRRVRPRRWSLHTRIVLATTAALLVFGPVFVLCAEWSNDRTLGQMNVAEKVLAAWFQGVAPRTAGFNTVDIGALREPTLNIMTGLMFIGAGPASTGGGIKVTTFAILGFMMWAEVRGDEEVNVFRRRLPATVPRQATTVALLAVGVVFLGGTALTTLSGFDTTSTLFEAASAFGTVGLSTGITPALPASGHYLLIFVMFLGRVGPVTFATALALSQRRRAYRYAEDRPLIG